MLVRRCEVFKTFVCVNFAGIFRFDVKFLLGCISFFTKTENTYNPDFKTWGQFVKCEQENAMVQRSLKTESKKLKNCTILREE